MILQMCWSMIFGSSDGKQASVQQAKSEWRDDVCLNRHWNLKMPHYPQRTNEYCKFRDAGNGGMEFPTEKLCSVSNATLQIVLKKHTQCGQVCPTKSQGLARLHCNEVERVKAMVNTGSMITTRLLYRRTWLSRVVKRCMSKALAIFDMSRAKT